MDDETAIIGLQSRYAQAVDDGDVEAILACFAPDAAAVYDGGDVTLTGEVEIRAFFEAAIVNLVGPANPCTHLLGGVTVDLDGDAASADASLVAYLSRPPGGFTMKGLRLPRPARAPRRGLAPRPPRTQLPLGSGAPVTDSVPLRFESIADRVVVPGGGSGIGRGVALALAEAGATVFVLGRREEKLAETAALAGSSPGRVVPIGCDVLDEEMVAAAFAAIAADGGPAPGLAHCAAAVTYVPAAELAPSEFREVVGSALFGAFNVLSSWGRALLAAGRPGAAVFVTSAIAARGTPGAAHSSAGKAAVEAMMRTVAREWGPVGLRLNCFGPGFFPVERNAEWIGDPANKGALEEKIALGRLGELHEAIGPILFLLSDAAGYTTGETLNVDGGFRLTPEVLPPWDYENLRRK